MYYLYEDFLIKDYVHGAIPYLLIIKKIILIMILKYLKTVSIAVFAMVSVNSSAQDLLAKQAPIDRKLKAVDSVALIRQIESEQAFYPAYTLYPEWSNDRVHAYGSKVTVPDTFRIDLTGFCMPTNHTKITSKCGPRWRRMHNGLDIKVYIGDTIKAAFDGRVRIVRYERAGYGKYVVIRHDNGLETIYGHLSKQLVKEDEFVKAGDVIGLGGNTGRSTGSHLHFETRLLGQVINPELLFDFPKQDIVSDNFLFIKGANMYSHQRTRALAAIKKGDYKQVVAASGDIKYHKIRRGDTLGSISRRYNISISRLCKINGIRTNTTLRIGQVLRCS